MNSKLLPELLSHNETISVNKLLIKSLGVNRAVFIGQLCNEYRENALNGNLTDDDAFCITHADLTDKIGFSKYEQTERIKDLTKAEILSTYKAGIPAKLYYKIDFEKMADILEKASPLTNMGNSAIPKNTAVVVKNATTESSSKRPKTNEEICPFFEELWKMYPQKLGKNRVSKKSLAEINKIGFDKMKAAIDNFNTFHKRRGTERKYLPYGSSFFNGVYKDFLDGVPNTMPGIPDEYAFFGRTV